MVNVEPEEAIRLISPRVIALITTTNPDGSTNASPYSWVFPFSFEPPMLTVGVGKGGKNTQKNAEREKEFVVNLVSKDFGQKACDLEWITGKDQLKKVGLSEIDSKKVKTKSIKESKVRIECEYLTTVDVKESDHVLVVGKIVAAECLAMKGKVPDFDKLDLLTHVAGDEFREVGKKVLFKRKRG
ncbi:MAG: flavin reductase family protein [Candidatus Diapherotrites archaeon]|nr:flavin reductase family protein [Candidatus Diapherotrites archaeon]